MDGTSQFPRSIAARFTLIDTRPQRTWPVAVVVEYDPLCPDYGPRCPIRLVEWTTLSPGQAGAAELYHRAPHSAFALLGQDCFGLVDFVDAAIRPDWFVRVSTFNPAMYGRLQDFLSYGAIVNTGIVQQFTAMDIDTLAFLLEELIRYRQATEDRAGVGREGA